VRCGVGWWVPSENTSFGVCVSYKHKHMHTHTLTFTHTHELTSAHAKSINPSNVVATFVKHVTAICVAERGCGAFLETIAHW
jgi:hypothetical protein